MRWLHANGQWGESMTTTNIVSPWQWPMRWVHETHPPRATANESHTYRRSRQTRRTNHAVQTRIALVAASALLSRRSLVKVIYTAQISTDTRRAEDEQSQKALQVSAFTVRSLGNVWNARHVACLEIIVCLWEFFCCEISPNFPMLRKYQAGFCNVSHYWDRKLGNAPPPPENSSWVCFFQKSTLVKCPRFLPKQNTFSA